MADLPTEFSVRSHYDKHGVSFGPFTLDEAKDFIRRQGVSVTDGHLSIIAAGDEREPNPRIYNYVDEAETSLRPRPGETAQDTLDRVLRAVRAEPR